MIEDFKQMQAPRRCRFAHFGSVTGLKPLQPGLGCPFPCPDSQQGRRHVPDHVIEKVMAHHVEINQIATPTHLGRKNCRLTTLPSIATGLKRPEAACSYQVLTKFVHRLVVQALRNGPHEIVEKWSRLFPIIPKVGVVFAFGVVPNRKVGIPFLNGIDANVGWQTVIQRSHQALEWDGVFTSETNPLIMGMNPRIRPAGTNGPELGIAQSPAQDFLEDTLDGRDIRLHLPPEICRSPITELHFNVSKAHLLV